MYCNPVTPITPVTSRPDDPRVDARFLIGPRLELEPLSGCGRRITEGRRGTGIKRELVVRYTSNMLVARHALAASNGEMEASSAGSGTTSYRHTTPGPYEANAWRQ